MPILQLLLLLIIANGAPVLARLALRDRLAWPLDFGLSFADGRALLGPRKTFRGVIAALVATTLAASLLGMPAELGMVVGLGAMLGDTLSSFLKRRLDIPPHGDLLGVDQIPESLLPLLLVQSFLELDYLTVWGLVFGFCVAELVLSKLLAAVERGRG